ncbi:Zn-ribbon domain-containing OB-fold protein [Streptomyces sp. NBC_01142]|uniref:Zn-ribbon domain-containing OB-fold protein n=1 Tax=Streptomyces sp. NBC_01142 TaxID=2975865 RepID=UPI0022541868|nr:Zn-ribbon domain-containing OB-fold protein [Streptomyces sp. NBC_01142]MCX4823842.1 Zn-ribbon domain-containing OB-fold protein [Streptomyces sp. NBC_01142]
MTVASRFDLPEADDFTRPFWDAAAEGRLLIRRCGACARAHHYPREFCPYCWSEDVVWERASGRATLYTWSVVHRNDLPPFGSRVPYTAAVVELAEGPRMMTEAVECAEGELSIGMELEVTFRRDGGGNGGVGDGGVAVPVFRPARPRSQGQSSSVAQPSSSRR